MKLFVQDLAVCRKKFYNVLIIWITNIYRSRLFWRFARNCLNLFPFSRTHSVFPKVIPFFRTQSVFTKFIDPKNLRKLNIFLSDDIMYDCQVHKILKFHLISWCGNVVETQSFRRVSGK